MNLDDYQKRASTLLFRGDSKTSDLLGLALGVCGEAGELAEKIKKLYFNKNMELSDDELSLISKEIGDVIWYLAALSSELNLSLGSVVSQNLAKLESRKARGVQKGEGDER